jgi:hypothetical protein
MAHDKSDSNGGDLTPPSALGIRRIQEARREAARAESTWDADVIPVMARFEDGKSPRPVMVLVIAGDMIVYHDMRGHLRGGAEAVAQTLDRAIAALAQETGCYPETIRVRQAAVAEALGLLLAPRQVRVEIDETDHLAAVAGEMIEAVTGVHLWPPICRPDTWGAWDLPHGLIKDLFKAAAEFFRQAPWRVLSNLQAPRALFPSGDSWTCCVLGEARQEFGLALYENASDLFDVAAFTPETEQPFAGVRGRLLSLTFNSAELAGDDAVREARLGRWEVAGPAAYPQLITVNSPGGGVTAEEIRELIVLLEAVPRFARANRKSMRREQQTGLATVPSDWRDEPSGVVFTYSGEAAIHDMLEAARTAGSGSRLTPEVLQDLDEAFSEATAEAGVDADPDTVLAAINRGLQARTSAYNQRPQTDLGGLSPAQVHRLLGAEWNTPDSALRFRTDLAPDDLGESAHLANARSLIQLAIEHNGLGLTQAGNLKLDLVAELLPRMQLDPEFVRSLQEFYARPKEQDVRPLHKLRIVCTLAGLLKRRGQQLERTRLAERLIDPSRAGELYARLFHTWFRKFNLGYGMRASWPELQHQVAYTLYRLPFAARDWRGPEAILNDVVLPFALEQAPYYQDAKMLLASALLESQVLDTLVGFGLLRSRTAGSPPIEQHEYAVHVLMDRFTRFEL